MNILNPDDEYTVGGGSGGDADMTDKGHVTKSATGMYQIGGNQVLLISRARENPDPTPYMPPVSPVKDPDPPDPKSQPSRIILVAGGTIKSGFMDDGRVDIRGCKGVRVTTGPAVAPDVSPPVSSDSTDGVEVVASELQSIKIHRGLVDQDDQKIEMTPGLPAGAILVDGGAGKVTIQSTTMVILQVGGSSIQLTPQGITINADSVSLVGETISASAVNTMSLQALLGALTIKGLTVNIN